MLTPKRVLSMIKNVCSGSRSPIHSHSLCCCRGHRFFRSFYGGFQVIVDNVIPQPLSSCEVVAALKGKKAERFGGYWGIFFNEPGPKIICFGIRNDGQTSHLYRGCNRRRR